MTTIQTITRKANRFGNTLDVDKVVYETVFYHPTESVERGSSVFIGYKDNDDRHGLSITVSGDEDIQELKKLLRDIADSLH